MTQYCRYCANLIVGDAAYCEAKQRAMSEKAAKRPNKCKSFEFVEIDAFQETDGYKPREKKEKDYEQATLFELPKN